MRIVGGRLSGRALHGPKAGSSTIRPSSDRLRESLFNILAHGHEDVVRGARVLDLFAGTGALGFEALSRGAGFALLVDDGIEARGIQRGNQVDLGLGGSSRIFKRDATRLGVLSEFEPFNLVFCDPPYRKGLGQMALASALAGGWLKPDALVVLEEAADIATALPDGFLELDRRRYGEGQVVIGKAGKN
jgi:16S rRNA (guanine966-N2)-methyltransferase